MAKVSRNVMFSQSKKLVPNDAGGSALGMGVGWGTGRPLGYRVGGKT